MANCVIKVPCSSANLGPGFDVMGLALDIFLELHVSQDAACAPSKLPSNFELSYEGLFAGTHPLLVIMLIR